MKGDTGEEEGIGSQPFPCKRDLFFIPFVLVFVVLVEASNVALKSEVLPLESFTRSFEMFHVRFSKPSDRPWDPSSFISPVDNAATSPLTSLYNNTQTTNSGVRLPLPT
jgi:hypothetical protein